MKSRKVTIRNKSMLEKSLRKVSLPYGRVESREME